MPGRIKRPWFGRNILEILEIALPLCNLVNLSIRQSLFLDQCMIAKLKPLFKGSKSYPELPVVSKIIEKTIHIQKQEYFDKNGLLYKY